MPCKAATTAIDLDLNVRSKPALHLMAMYGFE
jgi:hypothetical protein